MPSHLKLLKIEGGGALAGAVQKYHGGLNNFRELLYQKLGICVEKPDSKLEKMLEDYSENISF